MDFEFALKCLSMVINPKKLKWACLIPALSLARLPPHNTLLCYCLHTLLGHGNMSLHTIDEFYLQSDARTSSLTFWMYYQHKTRIQTAVFVIFWFSRLFLNCSFIWFEMQSNFSMEMSIAFVFLTWETHNFFLSLNTWKKIN